MERCRLAANRARRARRSARTMARRLAKPRHRALSRALLAALRLAGAGLCRLGRAQAQGQCGQVVDQGRAEPRHHAALSARARHGGGQLRPGLQVRRTVERDEEPLVLAQAGVKGGLKNEVGTIAMARTADPNSATAQFFVNVGDNSFLNWGDPRGDGNGYAVFGKVVSGLDVVNKIAKLPTGSGGPFPRDVPKSPVIIESMTVVDAK